MHPLRDKVVLITGGSSGIGQATALRLAQHGAKVALAARNQNALKSTAAQIESRGSVALPIPTDVTQADQCQRAVEATVDRFGGLDILLCSAGVSMRGYLEGSDLQALEHVMRVNFFGTLYITHYAIPHVKKRQGSFVAISSLTGKRGIPSYALYGASKFAIQGLYESLRVELQRDGVHVGIISPGFVNTPLRDKVIAPNGEVWADPPAPPFRVWPVEKCVDRVIRLIVKRQRQALLPWYTGPILALDQMVGGRLGDFILGRRFPRDGQSLDQPSNP